MNDKRKLEMLIVRQISQYEPVAERLEKALIHIQKHNGEIYKVIETTLIAVPALSNQGFIILYWV